MPTAKKLTTRDLEEKFAKTAFRLSQERNDFVLPQILDFVRKEKWINLRPEYQRRLVWDIPKRSLFIESLLLNVPIPALFLYEWDLGRYEVMDGQQRLTAVVEFYENGFPLRGLDQWRELNGLRYRELPETLQRGLDRRRLSATVLLWEGHSSGDPQRSDVRRLVFERLNTGGQHLNAQELRNCLYSGGFNELLIRLSKKREFAEIWEIPPYEDNVDREGRVSARLAENSLYRRMVDTEIVLRFFAFRNKSNVRGSVRGMLDRCMISHLDDTDEELADLEEIFDTRLHLAHGVFGARTFRHEDEDAALRLSRPLYDAVMVALDRLWEHRTTIRSQKRSVVDSIDKLLARPNVYEIIVGRPNTANAVLKRIEVIERAIKKASGV